MSLNGKRWTSMVWQIFGIGLDSTKKVQHMLPLRFKRPLLAFNTHSGQQHMSEGTLAIALNHRKQQSNKRLGLTSFEPSNRDVARSISAPAQSVDRRK